MRHRPIACAAAAVLLSACGGGNPLGNPPAVSNPAGPPGQQLSFVYFQRCVEPILQAELRVVQGSEVSLNRCAGSGCHDNLKGTGGALRLVPDAALVPAADIAASPEAVRTTDMYRNFYSAQASSNPGAPSSSVLLNKPQLKGVLHGGGLIFDDPNDLTLRRIAYWISRPVPSTQDEFGPADDMFTPADAATGACNAS